MRKIRASLAACAFAIALFYATPNAAGAINNGNLVIIGDGAAAMPAGSTGDKLAVSSSAHGSLPTWWWLLSLAQLSAR